MPRSETHIPDAFAPGRDRIRLATPLQRDILRTLLYFDIFDHPLSAEEVYRFLPSNTIRARDIQQACASNPLRSILRYDPPYYSIARDPGDATSTRNRIEKQRRAARYVRVANVMARIVSFFPFVRGVFITGELSKGVAGPGGDIDLMVVTAPGRLWVARTCLILFKKLLLLNSKRFFCLNHLVTEDELVASNRNVYTAVEVGTVVPLINADLYKGYLQANAWIDDYVPNLRSSQGMSDVGPYSNGILQRLLELPFRGRLGDGLDVWLMQRWRRVWRNRHPHLTSAQRDTLFRCERSISTAYAGDFLPKILGAYTERLRSFGLADS